LRAGEPSDEKEKVKRGLLLICIKLLWRVSLCKNAAAQSKVFFHHTGFYPLIYYRSFYSKEYI
jgi:hypothetical protein